MSKPQQFIKGVEEEFTKQFKPYGLCETDYPVKDKLHSFLRSQLSRLIEEMERDVPEEEDFRTMSTPSSEIEGEEYTKGWNDYHRSILNTFKEWEEGIKQ